MAGPSRRGASRSDTRERLLRVACRRFADFGYQETRIQDVCRLAGANIAAVNYHFGGKEGLYRAVWDHALEQTRLLVCRVGLDDGLEGGQDLGDRLDELRLVGILLDDLRENVINVRHESTPFLSLGFLR